MVLELNKNSNKLFDKKYKPHASDRLFNKLAACTDIHFGLKNNSRQHNIDCEDFLIWFIEEAKKANCETCIFLGDWHHSRNTINVSTMNYTLSNLERLSDNFEQVFVLPGNHDFMYREKREVNSIEFGRNIENIHIVYDPIVINNVSLLPWLVGDEWKSIKKIKCKYMFGHFEIPNFKMNAMVDMPDTGELHADDFTHPDYVFSGHFHKRQQKNNIIYIGNCFPHNFADAWDDERGAMFMEWGGEPTFKSWPNAPKYRKCQLSQLLENPNFYLDQNTYLRIEMDIHPSYEELNYIKEQLIDHFQPRDFVLMPASTMDDDPEFHGELQFESVESVVLSNLKSIESDNIDNELLVKIFRSL